MLKAIAWIFQQMLRVHVSQLRPDFNPLPSLNRMASFGSQQTMTNSVPHDRLA